MNIDKVFHVLKRLVIVTSIYNKIKMFALFYLFQLTEIEKEKDRKRKESNRISAKKCREKQKEDHKRNKMVNTLEENNMCVRACVWCENVHEIFYSC
jgi:hypothetical protein